MRWSKLKSLVEARFAPSLDGRVAIFSTRYGDCTCGRAWLTVDGEEVANFCTRAKQNAGMGNSPHEGARFGTGELSRQDAYAACWDFVHALSIDAALSDVDPLMQSLAVLDGRLGKRRLQGLVGTELHPLAAHLLTIRLAAEGLARA